ncbi:hypothetical protein WJX72_007024 [[Myrmecia] bisecta]|uniref:FAD-binding FR-type domain-containing protein n=1 Tax=[Myrmecia] bisecta TaxID=41462 RepID=A0AAW1QFP9_9CHLO
MCEVALPCSARPWREDQTPYHPGEREVQRLTGGKDVSFFKPRFALNAQHWQFFNEQPLLFTATRDAEGFMWASVLAGSPGFMTIPDPCHLKINSLRTIYQDPAPFKAGDRIGALGLQFHTRRRNRMNGHIVVRDCHSLTIQVDQSFGNCPKYIQARRIGVDAEAVQRLGREPREVSRGGQQLGAFERALVSRADTLFLATTHDQEITDSGVSPESRGHDASHRGGFPGFVQVAEDDGVTTIRWADYPGNNMYLSLGNIYSNPAAGLLFIDFDRGDTLQVTGEAQILFEERALPGALRTIQVRVQRWVCVRRALPLTVEAGADFYSPYNPGRPMFAAAAADAAGLLSNASLKDSPASKPPSLHHLTCVAVTDETHDVRTYHFKAPADPDGSRSLAYKAGQYASFDFFDIPGPDGEEDQAINRTWTISSHPSTLTETGSLTISVKKIGLVSGWLWDYMRPGAQIHLRAILGEFTPDAVSSATAPVLLIAGGIGITPMRAMMREFCGVRRVDTTLLYSVRGLEDAAFLAELSALAATSPKARVFLTTTRPPAATPAMDHSGAATTGAVVPDGSASSAAATVTAKPTSAEDHSGAAGEATTGAAVHMPDGSASSAAATVAAEGYVALHGRISAEMIQEAVPDVLQREVLLCGPEGFMQAVQTVLEGLDFPMEKVYTESFAF